MDLDRPLDLSRDGRSRDYSGTPAAFIEQLRRQKRLLVLDAVADADVAVEYPMGELWRAQTGCARFVQLREPRDGRSHALIRAPDQQATEREPNSGGGVRR